MIAGERYDLTLYVERRSSYQATVLGDMEVTKWRYQMHDHDGNRYVCTGAYVHGIEEGRTYLVRATCQRFDTGYNHWRLKRLARVREIKEGETLL